MQRLIYAALVLIAAAPLPAQALLATCSAATVPVSFGSYNTLNATPTDTTGTVNVTCSGLGVLVSYTISLSAGAGSFAQRKMPGSGYNLLYNLYSDAARSQIWGDGTGGTVQVSDSYLLSLGNTTRPYTVYGRIPARQNVGAGAYADAIIVTVSY